MVVVDMEESRISQDKNNVKTKGDRVLDELIRAAT